MQDVYVRTLSRAAAIVGGQQQLALFLKVTPSHLALWMGGLEPAPTHVFLQAVDLVFAKDPALRVQKPPPEVPT